MAIDEKEFTEEIDLFITQAEDEAKDEPTETVEPEASEAADDTSSEDGQEKPAAESAEDDADGSDPGAEASEDGGDGDTGEAEGSEQAESTAPAISDIALTVAVQAGMSLADARSFGSEEALLNVAERLSEARGDVALAREQQQPQGQEQPADPFADMPDLDPAEYDESVKGVIDMFNGMKAVVQEQNKRFDALQESQADAAQVSQAANDREAVQWFNSSIKGLDMAEALGEGGHSDLAEGSPQLAKRNAIAQQAAVLMNGYNASDQPAPTREEIFRVSARLVLADEYQALHDKGVSDGLKKRAGQHISRANGKKTKSTQSPEAEVAALIDAQFG